jgi:hypothetical protein
LIILGFATENLSNEWAKILPILDTDNNGEISSDEVDMRSDEAASETIEILNELRSNAQLISANINFYIQLNPNTFSYYEDQLGSVLGSISAYLETARDTSTWINPSYSSSGFSTVDFELAMYKEVIAFNTKLLTLLELGIGGALIYKSRRSRKLSNENSLKTKRELVNVDEDLMKMNIARQNIQTQIDELTLKLNDIREGRINIPVEIEGQSNLEEQIARLQMELTELSDVEITYGEESSESEDFGGLA